jgi:hypothetical protein
MLRRSGTCMVPNCTSDARNYLGLRLRKLSTRAVWAPNADAFLCKTHAEHGGKFRITYDPGTSGMVEVEVHCGAQEITTRTTPIRRRAV